MIAEKDAKISQLESKLDANNKILETTVTELSDEISKNKKLNTKIFCLIFYFFITHEMFKTL